jgi:hypothetical protein
MPYKYHNSCELDGVLQSENTTVVQPSLSSWISIQLDNMVSNALQLEYAVVDVFTHTKYEGNPLAIVQVPKSYDLSQEQKQKIAQEFNLSETTFVHEQEADSSVDAWTVDIFTAKEELPFAGHPTIGTACFLLSTVARERGIEGQVEAAFQLKAGPVHLSYDTAKNAAGAAIPHNVYVFRPSRTPLTWCKQPYPQTDLVTKRTGQVPTRSSRSLWKRWIAYEKRLSDCLNREGYDVRIDRARELGGTPACRSV